MLLLDNHELAGVLTENVDEHVNLLIINDLLTRKPLAIKDADASRLGTFRLNRSHFKLFVGVFVPHDASFAH